MGHATRIRSSSTRSRARGFRPLRAGDEVDAPAEQALQAVLQAEVGVVRGRPAEVHEHIHVAVGAHFVACGRAEQRELLRAKRCASAARCRPSSSRMSSRFVAVMVARAAGKNAGSDCRAAGRGGQRSSPRGCWAPCADSTRPALRHDPARADCRDPAPRLIAILAADGAGYSRLMAIDDRLTMELLDAARAVFREACAQHQGRVVDMAGDSVLLAFDSAASALRCALAVQPRLQAQANPQLVADWEKLQRTAIPSFDGIAVFPTRTPRRSVAHWPAARSSGCRPTSAALYNRSLTRQYAGVLNDGKWPGRTARRRSASDC